ARSITRTTTAHSSAIPMATTSRRCATTRTSTEAALHELDRLRRVRDELADRRRGEAVVPQRRDARFGALGRDAEQEAAAGLGIARERCEQLALGVGLAGLGGERCAVGPAREVGDEGAVGLAARR